MSTRLADLLALIGAACVLAGVYLLAGLPVALILLGLALIYIAWRLPERTAAHDEPD